MGNKLGLRIKAALMVIPLTVSVVAGGDVYSDKVETESDNQKDSIEFYSVLEKFNDLPSVKQAVKVVETGIENPAFNDHPNSKLTIFDILFGDEKKIAENTVPEKQEQPEEEKPREDRLNDEQKKVIDEMVEGYPIKEMLPYIYEQKPLTAIYLVAIAKKESNWGRRKPYAGGRDSYNYWGFKDRSFPTDGGGHSLFPSREVAVERVGNRIDKLVYDYGRKTPAQLIVWKCGSTCAGHSPAGVNKWISDVGIYYNRVMSAGDVT